LLRIRGNRDRRDKEGNLHVEDVLIVAYQSDGSRYEVAADEAVYSLDDREAILEGNVSLAGPDGLRLRSRALTLRDGGRWLESTTPVQLYYGPENPLDARARELRAFVEEGHFLLEGNVQVTARRPEGEPPFTLDARRVVFQRPMHLLRAEGGVTLKWGRSHL